MRANRAALMGLCILFSTAAWAARPVHPGSALRDTGDRRRIANGSPAQSTGPRGVLTITAATYDSVRVELRAGASTTCSANTLVETAVLLKGRVWSITSDQPLCWRHESGLGTPAAIWSSWSRLVLTAGQKVAITL